MKSKLYESDVFSMACKQFNQAADILQIEQEDKERTMFPQRMMATVVPVKMDDGTVEVFEGYRVQHNLNMGPTKGGVRFHPNVTIGEVAALSMWMSWKCALVGLPYGGGKGGITVDPSQLSEGEIERLSRRYMQEMIPIVGPNTDVMAPDMGTNPQVMSWMMDTYSKQKGFSVPAVVTGKPIDVGGSEGRLDATGFGVAFLVKRYLETYGESPHGAKVVIQGYGNVGSRAALKLLEYGAKIIGISDVSGGYYDPKGIDIHAALRYGQVVKSLEGWEGAERISNDELLELECDVLIPAALERVITIENAAKLKCRYLAEAANGPTTTQADKIIEERGDIITIPDVLCNSGGVIVSYFEWVQGLQSFFWEKDEVFRKLYDLLDKARYEVESQKEKLGVNRRMAALTLGIQRVAASNRLRGIFP